MVYRGQRRQRRTTTPEAIAELTQRAKWCHDSSPRNVSGWDAGAQSVLDVPHAEYCRFCIAVAGVTRALEAAPIAGENP